MPKFLESEEDQTDEKVSFSRRVNPKSKSTFMHCNTENSLCQALAREGVRVNRQRKKRKETLFIDWFWQPKSTPPSHYNVRACGDI